MLPKLNVLRLYALRTQFILARSLFAGSTSFCTHRLWAARHRYGCATMHSNTGRSTNHHLVTLYCVYVLCMQTIVTLAVPAGFLPLKGQGNTLSAPTPQSLYYFCFFFASERLCHTELNKWISFSFPVVVQLRNPTKQYLQRYPLHPHFNKYRCRTKNTCLVFQRFTRDNL